jgi:hypothetical protein
VQFNFPSIPWFADAISERAISMPSMSSLFGSREGKNQTESTARFRSASHRPKESFPLRCNLHCELDRYNAAASHTAGMTFLDPIWAWRDTAQRQPDVWERELTIVDLWSAGE